MLHVCLLSQKFPPMPGGISRYVQNISKELINLGVDVTVATLRPRGCPSFEKRGKVRVYRTLSGSDLAVNLYLLAVKRYIDKINRKQRIDIIHGQLPLIQTVLLPKNSHFVETVHSISKIEIDALKNLSFVEIAAWEKYLIVFSSVYRVLEKIVFSKADLCIAVSKHVKEEVLKTFKQQLSRKMTVVPNGVDVFQFNPEIDASQFRPQLGTEQDYVFGFLGRLCGRKNIKTLIRAFSMVVKEDSNVKLAIGGSGDAAYKNQLVKLARNWQVLDKIVFLGYIPEKEVPKFYAACDTIVVPSYQESFGITILEGMASAKPVIAAQAGGIVEFVKHSKNGMLFNPKDPKELARVMLRIKDSPKLSRQIASRARKTAETKYSWGAVTQGILRAYEILM